MSTPKAQRPLMTVLTPAFFDQDREFTDLDQTLRAAGLHPTAEQVQALLSEGVRGAGVWTANRTMKETQAGIDTAERIRHAAHPHTPRNKRGNQ